MVIRPLSQRALIRSWYGYFSNGTPDGSMNPRMRSMQARGLTSMGAMLLEGDAVTPLALFIRQGQSPLVRQILPNLITARRQRLIRKTITDAGGQTFSVPLPVLEQAEIIAQSIDVIDSGPSTMFRAPEQLLRAHVNVPWVRHGPVTRQAYFLSGYDANEPGLSYFFCELPQGPEPTTVEEAYEALKPEAVRVAEKMRRKVLRQGDMFFIRMPRRFTPHGRKFTVFHNVRLLNTNHFASTGVEYDGLVYVLGEIRHRPLGRRPDHRTLHLGRRRWWLCVKNTVPVGR